MEYFNTSNVTIQLVVQIVVVTFDTISIHLMLLFNQWWILELHTRRWISIHLMLLFNRINRLNVFNSSDFNTSNVTIQLSCSTGGSITGRISIHLMLLFNGNSSRRLKERRQISIHLMLLFNYSRRIVVRTSERFQYI